MKNEISLKNKVYNLIDYSQNAQNEDKISQTKIKKLILECNKWKKDYSVIYNENGVLKKYISKLEKNLGIEKQMENMRTLLFEKDLVLVNLSHQIREYQSKVDDIILGKTEESKDKQIKMLLNEVSGIRKKILNIITINDRNTNFDEFIEAIKTIQQLESKNKDKNIDKAFDKLNELIEIYHQNNDNAYSKFVEDLYGEGKNVNSLIYSEKLGKEQNNNNDDDDENVNDDNNNGGSNMGNSGL